MKIAFYPAKAVAHRQMYVRFLWYLDQNYISNIHVDEADNGQYRDHLVGQLTQTLTFLPWSAK